MKNINIETKTNGYKAEGLQTMIARFEKVAADIFPGCTVAHFYYGDELDFAAIIVRHGTACSFNITANRVSIGSYGGSDEEVKKWESMTYRDELFNGKLIELAGF